MIFNSLAFFFFFTSFFFLYWFIFNKSVKHQNLILLLGSYFFYAWADWRFLSFLIAVSALNYFLGIYIEKENKYKRLLVYIGLIQGIGGLVFFKYYNFFITSFNDVFHSLSINLDLRTLNIIIPLGISFFTFRTISYILDVDKGKIKATKDWVVFFNYISFFPSILSGPIDRAKLFVPQLEKKRVFIYSQAVDGMRQILWGFYKKIVVADNCAIITNQIFDNYQSLSGSSLLLGAFLYSIQVYADFSGYSDMAIGFSRLIGFNVTKNFDYPFFSQNIAEFWKKWHISLTSWLTEYLFTPLSIAFRDYGKLGLILAVLINFTIIGMWHGANWTYVLFGLLHGCFFIPLILNGTMNKKKKTAKEKLLPSIREFINMLGTFTIVLFSFVIFRVQTIAQAIDYYSRLFSRSMFSFPNITTGKLNAVVTLFFITLMFIIEWFNREQQFGIQFVGLKWSKSIRWSFYISLILMVFYFFISSDTNQQFIYFQF
jgi:alginate O-acetyltransferase complex protein AlgI